MEKQRKLLCRVRLINWHYFENECISMNGSTLISGENTAGKSTIMDAIAMVLTTNTRKFNVAANEKGNRNLTGYVRCKVGNVGETYLRKNVVPANVALEFYEEKTEKYFVIGVHMLSADEESRVTTKWYVSEGRLEELSFIVDGRAALANEFRKNGQKITYIDHANAARDRFKRRLGNLDDKFFDIIPKSLAFKPMDNVKEFINKFVLSEEKIDVALLRENIEHLTELEETLEGAARQLRDLEEITEKFEAVDNKKKDLLVNDFLLRLGSRESISLDIENMKRDIAKSTQYLSSNREIIAKYQEQLDDIHEQIVNIDVAIKENASSRLVEELERQLQSAQKDLKFYKNDEEDLKQLCKVLKIFLRELVKLDKRPVTADEVKLLETSAKREDKVEIIDKINTFFDSEFKGISKKYIELDAELERLNKRESELVERQKALENHKLTYPENTTRLKQFIEKEFEKRKISSKVYILAELLEITDAKWINAIEGYFDRQKFYLIVEPEYYDIALECYHRNRERVHSAGIINTKKIVLDEKTEQGSLAGLVKSDNRYAKAYANYILGRVICCDNVRQLEEYDIAMTPDCMLYQGFVVRNINPKRYENPFIGQNAYRVQLVNVKKEREEINSFKKEIRNQHHIYKDVVEAEKDVNVPMLISKMEAPLKAVNQNKLIAKINAELNEAKNNPTLIELNVRRDEKDKEYKELENAKEGYLRENGRLEKAIEQYSEDIKEKEIRLQRETAELNRLSEDEGVLYHEALEKYKENRKTKTAEKIVQNFTPQKTQFENEKDELLNGANGLKERQRMFNSMYNQDFQIGLEGRRDYYDAMAKLKSVEIVRYEENLKKTKEDCEEIFKSDFLSKMKEHIEAARNEFRNLNKALSNIYYGDDSYHFDITFDKRKEGLYRMITSENNQEGYNLWTAQFEAEYREEMAELFDKLMTKDDNGQKIVEEYTDYRSYLDYDIEIRKRNGSRQKFSAIYGEKSGSETQVPYYVAIAASFYQLYRFGNSVRLMLLDEAFDKMDDERIISMMNFFNGLDLQVILATPPAKIEVIGESVGTVLTAIREGQMSICEEYDL